MYTYAYFKYTCFNPQVTRSSYIEKMREIFNGLNDAKTINKMKQTIYVNSEKEGNIDPLLINRVTIADGSHHRKLMEEISGCLLKTCDPLPISSTSTSSRNEDATAKPTEMNSADPRKSALQKIIGEKWPGAKVREANKYGYHAVKNNKKEILAYIGFDEDETKPLKIFEMPEKCLDRKAGASKILTHMDSHSKYVCLTVKKDTCYSKENTDRIAAIHKEIGDQPGFVQQIRVSDEHLFAERMDHDLRVEIDQGIKVPLAYFKDMLQSLRVAHEHDVALLDINPGNFLINVEKGIVRYSDFDAMHKGDYVEGDVLPSFLAKEYAPELYEACRKKAKVTNNTSELFELLNKSRKKYDNFMMLRILMEATLGLSGKGGVKGKNLDVLEWATHYAGGEGSDKIQNTKAIFLPATFPEECTNNKELWGLLDFNKGPMPDQDD